MKNEIKIALVQLNPLVGDLINNVNRLIEIRSKLPSDIDIIVTPELYITGYPIDDLVLREDFLLLVEEQIKKLANTTKDNKSSIIVGAPRKADKDIRNSVFVLDNGKILTYRDKYELPNTGVFDEQRIFKPGSLNGPVNLKGIKIGLPICEDIWDETVCECYSESGAEVLIVINASPFTLNKKNERFSVVAARVHETKIPLIYLNRVGGQDELIFDGSSFCINANGKLFSSSLDFEEQTSLISLKYENDVWFGSGTISKTSDQTEGLYKALVLGLRDYVKNNNFPGVILGLSGGIDSALVASIATDALGPELVETIMLPSPFTSRESLDDAKSVADFLRIKYSILSISESMSIIEGVLNKFEGPKFSKGIAEENIQSRLRGLLLMAVSNRFGKMVLATGNKSEYAVGYATLYGDMCGGYAPLKDVWKTDVFRLSKWRNKNYSKKFLGPKGFVMPDNIISKSPSAELRDNQKDTDSLPDYEVLDEILKGLVEKEISIEKIISNGFQRDDVEKVSKLLARSEYKRFQSAPGPKVTSKAFGRDRRFPLTSGFKNWH